MATPLVYEVLGSVFMRDNQLKIALLYTCRDARAGSWGQVARRTSQEVIPPATPVLFITRRAGRAPQPIPH